jgi:glucose/arabinose dehydrogenase
MSYPTTSATVLVALCASFAGAGVLMSACSDDSSNSSTTGATTSTGTGTGGSPTGGGGNTGSGGNTTSSGTAGGGTGGGLPQPTVDCSPPRGAEGPLKLTVVASGIDRPLLVKNAPGDPSRLFVVSQNGRIFLIKDGVLQQTPFLDIDDLVPNVSGGDERGLLGLAFHPNYQQNGRFFVHYSDTNTGDTRIAEFRRGANDDTADPVMVGMILTQDQPQVNHNGGSIEFSPVDGFLYIGLGDGGGANDQHGTIGNGQDTGTLLGKILRIDVSTTPYSIPQGNLTGAGVLPEIWDYGMRNPYRFSFDACTADLYIGDVGQGAWEEIDVEPAGQGNLNYGWRVMEGTHCFNPAQNCDQTGKTLPVAEYSHNTDGCSVTGGYVYRGTAIPWLRGAYFYGDYCSGNIWTLRYEGGVASAPVKRTQDLGSQDLPIVGFGQDYAGEVYVTTLDGNVYRIDAE